MVEADEPDSLLAGRLRLRQPRRGHRAGTDAVLLGAAAPVAAGDRFIDAGAGVGTVGLMLALREPGAGGRLIEVTPDAAALARENVALNGLEGRVSVECFDLFDREVRRSLAGSASLVVTNPPFFTAGSVRSSPSKSRAHVLERHDREGDIPSAGGGHGEWLRACLALLAPRGRLVMIHRPDALPDLFAAAAGRLGDLAIKPVHAFSDGPAIRVLVSGKVASRGPLRLLPPLVLHRTGGAMTDEAAAIHRGELFIDMR